MSFVVAIWVMLCAVVPHVGGARFPIIVIAVLTLRFSTTEPVKVYVHGLNVLGYNGVVCESGSCGVVGLNGQLWLGPIYFSEGIL